MIFRKRLRIGAFLLARRRGRGRSVFDKLEQELRTAVDRGALALMYQPIVDAHSMSILTFEALLRWDRVNGERVMPAAFVPLAEATGLIVPIGEWAIFRACEWLTRLRARDRRAGSIRVSVNVSARQLEDREFPRRVISAIRSANADASCLCLEMTESGLLRDRETALHVLRELGALGIDVSLDDFGAGYSSFHHLALLEVSALKLDKAFFAIAPESRKRAVLEAMVRVGQQFDMCIIAEGVETMHDLEVAKAAGCDAVQGYYIARPLSPEDAVQFARSSAVERDRIEARRR